MHSVMRMQVTTVRHMKEVLVLEDPFQVTGEHALPLPPALHAPSMNWGRQSMLRRLSFSTLCRVQLTTGVQLAFS